MKLGLSSYGGYMLRKITFPELPHIRLPDLSKLPSPYQYAKTKLTTVRKLFPTIGSKLLTTFHASRHQLGKYFFLLLKIIGDENVTALIKVALTVALPKRLVFLALTEIIGVEAKGFASEENSKKLLSITLFGRQALNFIKDGERYYCTMGSDEVTLEEGVAELKKIAREGKQTL